MGMIMFFVLRTGLIGSRNSWEEVAVEAEVCRNQKRRPRKQSVVTEKAEEIFLPWNSTVTFHNLKKNADIKFLSPWKLWCFSPGLGNDSLQVLWVYAVCPVVY